MIAPSADLRSAPLKVLLLEDSKFDAELLREHLRVTHPQAELRLVSSEEGFVAALAAESFDVILSDYELPGFTGSQALQHAQAMTPRTPFIFVSGVIGEDNAVEMLKQGATDYVSKARMSRLPVVLDRALREAAEREARERAESQLREADARYARVVDSLRDYAVILLDVHGTITAWNRAAGDIFGYRSEEVLGESAALLFAAEDRACGVFHAEMRAALAEGKANDDRWLQRRNGSRLWAEGVMTPLYSDAGEHKGFSKILHDATAEHEDAAALRAAKEDAERANRAKDRFLAVLSHELRTPLTPIASAAHLLERSATVPAEHRGLLPMIRRNVALEARLIDDLLDLTAISTGKMSLKKAPVDMHELVRVVVEMVGEQITEKQLQLSLDLQAVMAVVEADEARMQQVLWNIVRNATKFTPPGGRIDIRTRSEDELFTLECTDTGIGIDAEVLPRIFQAFEQADNEVARRYGGLGLGLAIARGLVHEHQGELSAHSEGRDRGATLRLTLQCFQALPDAARLPGVPTGSLKCEALACRVLLVEDNLDAAEALVLSLESYGYVVSHAVTRAAAVETARQASFDVAVTDLGLPDGSGIDLGRELSSRFPVIALSGYGNPQDLERTAMAGFSGHLTKPADPAAVHALLQQVLAEAKQPAAGRRIETA